MKNFGLKWIDNDNDGAKLLYNDKSRLTIYDFPYVKINYLTKDLGINFAEAGIYILIEENGSKVYVGESDNIALRLRQHTQHQDKKWFDRVIAIMSSHEWMTFNKSEQLYLEQELIRCFNDSPDYDCQNFTQLTGKKFKQIEIQNLKSEYNIILESLKILGYKVDLDSSQKSLEDNGNSVVENNSNFINVISKYKDLQKNPIKAKYFNRKIYFDVNTEIKSKIHNIEIKDYFRPIASHITRWLNEDYIEILNLNNRSFKEYLLDVEQGKPYHIKIKRRVMTSPSSAAGLIKGKSQNGWISWELEKTNKLLDTLR